MLVFDDTGGYLDTEEIDYWLIFCENNAPLPYYVTFHKLDVGGPPLFLQNIFNIASKYDANEWYESAAMRWEKNGKFQSNYLEMFSNTKKTYFLYK